MEKVKITIDGQQIEVEKNTTVLEAAKRLNKLIPTFCYNEKLPIFGGCRMCLVWDKKAKRSIIACGTYVYDGMEIETLNEQVFNDRKFILEMLFTRHPLDCPVCDKAGECDLQNWGTYYGPQHNVLPISPLEKIRPEEDWESDYLEFVSNRCVLCLRCVSICKNINGSDTLFQEERGFEILISPNEKPMDSESSCEMCGLCVDVCPVGAILFKPFKYKARPWLLKEKVSYCGFCSMNCPVAIDYDDKKKTIYRIRSTADFQVCAGAYLGYDTYNTNRLKSAKINGKPVSYSQAFDKVASIISKNPTETAVIASPYSTIETFEQINKLRDKTKVKVSSTITLTLMPTIAGFKNETGEDYKLPTFLDIYKSKKVVIVGDDISAVTPVLSYFFNEQYKEGNKIADKKQVIYVGTNLKNSSKFFPEQIKLENILNIELSLFDDETSVIYSTSTLKGEDAYNFGKLLGKIKKQKGSHIFIIPPEANAIGMLNTLKITDYLVDITENILDGKIKNLILFGEDILEHFEDQYINQVFEKLENLILISPFDDGLAQKANISIGSTLWMEEEGTFEGFFGLRKIKPALKPVFFEKDLVKNIEEKALYTPNAVVNADNNPIEFYNFQYFKKKDINLYDFSFFSNHSKNLTNWKNKKEVKLWI